MKKIFLAAILAGMTIGFAPGAVLADSPQECRNRCEKIQDNMQHATQSGATVNAYEDCMDGCAALESAMNAFKDCIKSAGNNEDAKQACRDSYMSNRP